MSRTVWINRVTWVSPINTLPIPTRTEFFISYTSKELKIKEISVVRAVQQLTKIVQKYSAYDERSSVCSSCPLPSCRRFRLEWRDIHFLPHTPPKGYPPKHPRLAIHTVVPRPHHVPAPNQRH